MNSIMELSQTMRNLLEDSKEEAWGYREPIERPRRRRSNRYCGEYTTAGNLALKNNTKVLFFY